MVSLIETLCIENGRIRNLEYHNQRFNSSREALFGETGTISHANLAQLIRIPGDLGPGIYRCRVRYGHEIEEVEFLPHRPRIIRSLKIVRADDIEYSFKYADRTQLKKLFAQKGTCDEILIIKHGFVTDTSISNVVFRTKDGSWITPDTPLLNGTMRMWLLEARRITEVPVRPEDLPGYTGARLINCMRDLDSGPTIRMNRIIP